MKHPKWLVCLENELSGRGPITFSKVVFAHNYFGRTSHKVVALRTNDPSNRRENEIAP
jgi:hypothetical protein